MTDPDSIVHDMTSTNPVVFTQPWTDRLEWRRDDEYGMCEYACTEGDVQIRDCISASRAQRAKERENSSSRPTVRCELKL